MRALDPHRSAIGLSSWKSQDLLSIGTTKTFSPGKVLMSQGPAAAYAALITSGIVKVTMVGNGEETFLAIRGEGDFIGETAAFLISQQTHLRADGFGLRVMTGLTYGTAQVFPVNQLKKFFEKRPSAALMLVQDLCEQLADAEARIASSARDNADRRLARLLYEVGRYGHPVWERDFEGTELPIRFTHEELASWIGASRETVDRTLRRWRARRIVSTNYRTIVINDPDTLARIGGARISNSGP